MLVTMEAQVCAGCWAITKRHVNVVAFVNVTSECLQHYFLVYEDVILQMAAGINYCYRKAEQLRECRLYSNGFILQEFQLTL